MERWKCGDELRPEASRAPPDIFHITYIELRLITINCILLLPHLSVEMRTCGKVDMWWSVEAGGSQGRLPTLNYIELHLIAFNCNLLLFITFPWKCRSVEMSHISTLPNFFYVSAECGNVEMWKCADQLRPEALGAPPHILNMFFFYLDQIHLVKFPHFRRNAEMWKCRNLIDFSRV